MSEVKSNKQKVPLIRNLTFYVALEATFLNIHREDFVDSMKAHNFYP